MSARPKCGAFVQNARCYTHVTACTLPLNILINRNKLSYCYLPLLLLKLLPPRYSSSSLRLFMERRISFNFIDEEVDRASSSGRARYDWDMIDSDMSDSNLRPRLLALTGPNYPTVFQPIERKSPSLCLGSKALPTSHAPFWRLSRPLSPAPDTLACRLLLRPAEQFPTTGPVHFRLPLSETHSLWMDLPRPATRVLLKCYSIQNSEPSSSCHISHVLCFIPLLVYVTGTETLIFAHSPQHPEPLS